MSYQIAESDRRTATLIQVGTIAEVDYENARCRVKVGEWVSALMPWASLGAGAVRHWRPPSVGEQAMLFCPSGESSAGFVLPGLYTDQHQQGNDSQPNITAWDFPDGTRLDYDHTAGRLYANLRQGGTVEVIATGGVKIVGDVEVIGKVTVSKDVVAGPGAVSLISHTHTGVLSGGGVSGIPVNGSPPTD